VTWGFAGSGCTFGGLYWDPPLWTVSALFHLCRRVHGEMAHPRCRQRIRWDRQKSASLFGWGGGFVGRVVLETWKRRVVGYELFGFEVWHVRSRHLRSLPVQKTTPNTT
jgi:hypothetical protein